MGLEAIYQAPGTSVPHPAHRIYPYLLTGLAINRPNHVWCADITYIPTGSTAATGRDKQSLGSMINSRNTPQLRRQTVQQCGTPAVRVGRWPFRLLFLEFLSLIVRESDKIMETGRCKNN